MLRLPLLPLPLWSKTQIAALSLLALVCSGWALTLVLDEQHQADQTRRSDGLQQRYATVLADDHQRFLQQQTLAAQKAQLQKDFDAYKSDPSKQKQTTIDGLLSTYADIQSKVTRNNSVKLDTTSVTNQYGDWGTKLLNQQFDALNQSLNTASKSLDDQYQQYQASLIKPTPTKSATSALSSAAYGYSYQTVSTGRGAFGVHLIKMKLSEVTVKTLTANTTNCTNNCPNKSLAQYVASVGGYAGINGTYFCPPDYASCAGKTYSYDFAVYNSQTGNWLNANALSWDSEGLATFSGHSATFYRQAKDYDGHPVSAGIADFPDLLVQHGQVITTTAQQSTAQQQKGTRGELGIDGIYIYLAQISNANLTDAAYAMQALGATDVLNLDGGGSSAMYVDGSYKVGPGRSLPNAVVLVRN